jgi:hypothetical protein
MVADYCALYSDAATGAEPYSDAATRVEPAIPLARA